LPKGYRRRRCGGRKKGAWLYGDISGEPLLLLFIAERHRAAGDADKAEAVLWPAFDRRSSMWVFATMAVVRAGDAKAANAMNDEAAAPLAARLAPTKAKVAFAGNDLAGLGRHPAAGERRPAAWAAAHRHGCPAPQWLQLPTESETDNPNDALEVYARLVEQQIALTSENTATSKLVA